MQFKFILFSVLIIGFVMVGHGQSTRDVNTPKPPAPRYQAVKKKEKRFLWGLFSKKKVTIKTHAEEVAEFRDRMQQTARKKAKEAKLAEKPQYSNPLYFGHKKPPKKRKNGKKKFCKECGLVH